MQTVLDFSSVSFHFHDWCRSMFSFLLIRTLRTELRTYHKHHCKWRVCKYFHNNFQFGSLQWQYSIMFFFLLWIWFLEKKKNSCVHFTRYSVYGCRNKLVHLTGANVAKSFFFGIILFFAISSYFGFGFIQL